MLNPAFFKKSNAKRITTLLLVLLIALGSNSIAQVSNPRTPAEWEEVQAVVMEVEMKSLSEYIPWNLVVDPYVKTAQACVDEGVDLYIIEKKSHSYRYPEKFYMDTVFSNRGIESSKIHFIEYPDNLRVNYIDFWARDNGMFCVYENGVGNISMYHFENDYASEVVDSYFGWETSKIEQQGSLGYKFYDGGNFLTDGHGTFNIMSDYTTGIESDYLHFSTFFGIQKSVKFVIGGAHIDVHMKMLNEEVIVLDEEELESSLKNTYLTSTFGRNFKVIKLDNPPVSYADEFIFNRGICGYSNALIINGTVLVPQYACKKANFEPETDSIALEAYKKAMPGYNVIGVNCSAYQIGGGALHCLTHEIPANNPIYIKHKWLADTVEYITQDYTIEALVQSARGIDNVKLFWRLNSTDSYTEQNMILSATDTFTATIPNQNIDTEIEYYITATDKHSKSISKPFVAPKGTYKSQIVKVGAITHPDSLYTQPFFPCLPNGLAIQNATITINNTTLTTNSLTNDTIATIKLKTGTYPFTVTSPDIIGEYQGVVNVNNRYPDTINITANPFEFVIKGQHDDLLEEAKVTFSDYTFSTVSSKINYAFEGDYNYEIYHPAMVDTTLGSFTIAKNEYGNSYLNNVQQEQVELNLDFYKLSVFPCLPNGTAAFSTSIDINSTTLTSNPLTSDSIVNIFMPVGDHPYTITSPNIIGEYNGTWQHSNSYTDTIKAIINPIEFLKNAKVEINGTEYLADNTACIYSFSGTYSYTFTHSSMVDTALGELTVVENTYGTNYINHIPKESADIAQLNIKIDNISPAGEDFYKEKYPANDYVPISDDGMVYFTNGGLYNYEIFADRLSFIDTITIEPGKKHFISLFNLNYNPSHNNWANCFMVVNNDTLNYNKRNTFNYRLHDGEYPYTTYYKKEDTKIPLGSGIVSPSNKTIIQNVFAPTYVIVSDQGTALTNAQIRTNTGNNTFIENANTYGIVFKENQNVICTVSCEGYLDSTFIVHADDLLHTIQLVTGTNPVHFTVTFVDHNGTELSTQTVSEGSTASAPNIPVHEGRTFIGWDDEFDNVTSDLTITAQYRINSYTVTFLDWDHSILKTESVEHGSDAIAPVTPTRTGFTFTGWDVDFANVTSDLIVTAQYGLVTFINESTESKLYIYPNPVKNGWLNIKSDKTISEIRIYNLTGNEVFKSKGNTKYIDIRNLPKGVYLIKVDDLTRRLIVK